MACSALDWNNITMLYLLAYRESVSPDELIRHFRLREPRFAEMCRNGLFT